MLFCWSLKKDCEIIAEPERQELIEGGIDCDGDCWHCDESEMHGEYMEPMEFLAKYWPINPNKLMASGVKVPLMYLTNWLSTYGCNNWRKMHKMPMWRKKLQFERGERNVI